MASVSSGPRTAAQLRSTGELRDDIREPRKIIDPEQRTAGGQRHEGLTGAEARPDRGQPRYLPSADLEVDVLAVLLTATVDDFQSPAMQRMERMRHPCT